MSNVYFRFYDSEFVPPSEYEPFKNCYTLDSEYIKKENLWSTYKVQFKIVEHLVDKDNTIKYGDYILCPLYAYKGEFSDFQFGVTETRKIGESDASCFKRALGEELGLRYSEFNLRSSHDSIYTKAICFPNNSQMELRPPREKLPDSFTVENYGKKFKIYTLNIKDPHILPVTKSIPSDNIPDDKYATKCGAVVYGPEKDIFDFLNRQALIFDKNDDVIVGTVAVKFSDAIRHFYKPPSPYKKKSIKSRNWSTKKKNGGKRSRKIKKRKRSKRRSRL
jgi:hypothetical protein